jgi:hypothetical protein
MEGGMTRRIGLLAAVVTMGAAGWYVFVYLYRWEWNRALISGVIFLAAEIGLLGAVVLGRMVRLERRLDDVGAQAVQAARARVEPDPRVLARLHESEPAPRDPFAWLTRRPDQVSVFVPVLLGAGAVLSGLAWVVERVARRLTGPAVERNLARRLHAIALPSAGFVGRDDDRPDLFSPLP